jgi:GNAT superfamily N-acetyltransferase
MFTAMGVTSPDPSWRENAHEWFSSRLDDPNYHFAVVEVDGTVVACAVGAVRDAAPSPAAPEGRDVLVNNVSTAPPFRGRGYGRMAFDSVMVWARELGIRPRRIDGDRGRARYVRTGGLLRHDVPCHAREAGLTAGLSPDHSRVVGLIGA